MMDHGPAIAAGVVAGTIARWLMLCIDYRNYPGFPHGYVTHMSLGFIAAFLGAVAVPALVEGEFTAVTFLALAAQQFREVRAQVRESLELIDAHELIKRGPNYVDGIARAFEARNYLVMMVSLLTSSLWDLIGPPAGLAGTALGFLVARGFMRGKRVGDIANIREGRLRFDGPNLYVDHIYIMNVGLPEMREAVLKYGLGVLIEPIHEDARDTLNNPGQRQAIVHDAARYLGARKDIATPEFTPLIRKDVETGTLGMVITPMERDVNQLLAAIKRVPVLETAKGTSMHTRIGRRAAD